MKASKKPAPSLAAEFVRAGGVLAGIYFLLYAFAYC